ncbi:uncharacterized protein PADG_11408 [Paracoccidioides brasiliensis Pb18]|uniref:Uncharacterized protein n=1 Tax=Paracoccidioides brasiliensis (strain Pb18) TaxID=502780 RepID=A0A0A0HVG5_PARBD|nr:uncharacterized protein PADG_11408 [Paracoccidioides brasiliensis Pb18]KGM92577.1 hypothetical protein PADG_11408 [Paracoccidioides brasiliensis Pb18]
MRAEESELGAGPSDQFCSRQPRVDIYFMLEALTARLGVVVVTTNELQWQLDGDATVLNDDYCCTVAKVWGRKTGDPPSRFRRGEDTLQGGKELLAVPVRLQFLSMELQGRSSRLQTTLEL